MKVKCLLLLLLAGCVGAQGVVPAKTLVYRCNESYAFTARENSADLQLFLPSGEHQLMREESRVGRVYASDKLHLLVTDDVAELKIAGQGERQCVRDRGGEVWAEARFRGVEFRAAGTKPGWFAELQENQLLYAGNYGQQRLVFNAVKTITDDNLVQTTLAGTIDSHHIELLLQPGDCWEGTSQKMFDIRVTLDLDGKIIYGCGKKLQ